MFKFRNLEHTPTPTPEITPPLIGGDLYPPPIDTTHINPYPESKDPDDITPLEITRIYQHWDPPIENK